MDLATRCGEESSQVVQALGVSHPEGVAFVFDRPVVALTPERSGTRGRDRPRLLLAIRAGDPRDPRRQDHAERRRRRERGSIELVGPHEIVGLTSSPENLREIVLGVRRPWTRAHRLECRDRRSEVTLGIVDVADRCCQQAEVAIDRTDASLSVTDRM